MTKELGSVATPASIGLARVAVRGTTDRDLRRSIRERACVLLGGDSGLREVTVRLRRLPTQPPWECSLWAAGRSGPMLLVALDEEPLGSVQRAVDLVRARSPVAT